MVDRILGDLLAAPDDRFADFGQALVFVFGRWDDETDQEAGREATEREAERIGQRLRAGTESRGALGERAGGVIDGAFDGLRARFEARTDAFAEWFFFAAGGNGRISQDSSPRAWRGSGACSRL